MTLSSSELDRIADDIYKDRRISGSVYCGTCGYNLRTLPYVYTCPECGQEYNARPLVMKGIFAPHDADIPFGDFASALFCAAAAYVIGQFAFEPIDPVRLIVGGVFAGFSLIFVHRTYVRFLTFLKARRVARRIAMEDDG
jgi:hypothetical protein